MIGGLMEEKFNYFMDQTNERLEKIDHKLDVVIGFRWQIIGGAMAASTAITLILNVLYLLFK